MLNELPNKRMPEDMPRLVLCLTMPLLERKPDDDDLSNSRERRRPFRQLANNRRRVTKRSYLLKLLEHKKKSQPFLNRSDPKITALRSCGALQCLMKLPVCINHLNHLRNISKLRFRPRTFTFSRPNMAVNAEHHHATIRAEAQSQRIPPISSKSEQPLTNGDLNNTASMRITLKPERRPDFAYRSLSISASMDEPTIRSKYRPFLLPHTVQQQDWVRRLELATVTELVYNDLRITGERIKVLILYGSLRQR